ncbi:MAG TPA: hypothetical protein P5181_09120 [Dermatophilaceae bacterium]|nr:hypothetical protein [Dermatophilaceae bacterium]
MRLPHLLIDRAEVMLALLRRSREVGLEPWGSMYVTGHGAQGEAQLLRTSNSTG